jgi:predicted nucleic acid-binding protein
MKVTRYQLRKIIAEAMELDLEVGDVILTGRFKNKRTVVKKLGKDDLGQPTVNGMKLLSFRIEKLMPKEKWSKKSIEALEFADSVEKKK